MVRQLACVMLCCALSGCELVANFDRSKIVAADAGRVSVGKGPDAGTPRDAGSVLDAAAADAASASGEDGGGADAGR